jgi:2-methylisocitrate lyase-like PEP mutase family enzyme
VLSAEQLHAIGYRLAIFPALGFLSAGAALEKAYTGLKEKNSSVGLGVPLYDFQSFSKLMGFEAIAEFDKRYSA